MEFAFLLWNLVLLLLVLALGAAALLFCWWLWRKITLPQGAEPPKFSDLSTLRIRAGRAPVVIRLVVASLLGLLMSAPISVIHDLIRERAETYDSVVDELSYSWGGQQLLIGPVLSIPYTIQYTVKEEKSIDVAEQIEMRKQGDFRSTRITTREVSEERKAILLPEELYVDGQLEPQQRQRGIYSVRVYTADLALSGVFKKPDFKKLDSRTSAVHWNRASILVNLSDTKAFKDISPLTISGHDYKFVPGTNNSAILPTGFSAEVDLSAAAEVEFNFDMSIGGSQGFYVSPIAVSSTINLQSPWPHPKFSGTGLPTRHETGDAGFNAVWEVPNLVRNYPQFADSAAFSAASKNNDSQGLNLAEYTIGLDFFEPVFHYSLLTRAVKYAMMFIGLTFLSVLIFEIVGGKQAQARLHLAQYGIIGLGLCLFYLVLLAVAEHLPFLSAYLLAAAVNISMIGGYVWAALKSRRAALVVTAILATLYSALFFILRMEEYSLISGTFLVVAAMVALMYATRNLGREVTE